MNEVNNTPLEDGGIEIRLWQYIDGLSDSSEQAAIQKLIAENVQWRSKYQELLEVHQMVQSAELEEPSMRFSKNVMEEIAKYHIAPATKNYINQKIIWGIAAFFITVIVAFIVYGFSQVDWSTGSTNSSIGIDFTRVNYSRIFDNSIVNYFMMANVILGLMLFDHYLGMKKKAFRKTT